MSLSTGREIHDAVHSLQESGDSVACPAGCHASDVGMTTVWDLVIIKRHESNNHRDSIFSMPLVVECKPCTVCLVDCKRLELYLLNYDIICLKING